jgi:lysozyme
LRSIVAVGVKFESSERCLPAQPVLADELLRYLEPPVLRATGSSITHSEESMAAPLSDWTFHFDPAQHNAFSRRVDGLVLGVDPSEWQDQIDWTAMRGRGKWFSLPKMSGYRRDKRFDEYWAGARDAGLVRGPYHFFSENPAADQAQLFLGILPRLAPGDLPPSLDIESDKNNKFIEQLANGTLTVAAIAAGMTSWLQAVERALGRRPMLYLGSFFRDDVRPHLANQSQFTEYLLWVVDMVNHPPQLLGWPDWACWQYAEDGTAGYHEPGIGGGAAGIDFNAFRGSIHELRGLADLGAPAVTLDGALVIHGEPRLDVGSAPSMLVALTVGQDPAQPILDANGTPVIAAGDPIAIAGTSWVVWRGRDAAVWALDARALASPPISLHAVARDAGTPPAPIAPAFSDPSGFSAGTRAIVLFTDEGGDLHALWTEDDGSWTHQNVHRVVANTAGGMIPASCGASGASDDTGWRLAYRAIDGTVHEATLRATDGQWLHRDLTAAAGAATFATGEPAVYFADGVLSVAHRGVGGGVYELSADRALPQGVDASAAGPQAAGSVAVYIERTIPHLVYRSVDGAVVDAGFGALDASPNTWLVQDLTASTTNTPDATDQPPRAAADPVVWIHSQGAVHVTWRGVDGSLYDASSAPTGWTGRYLRGPD